MMNPKARFDLMSSIDYWIGVPLCIILGFLTKLTAFLRRRKTDRPISRILILKWFGIGSIILMEPLLRAIHKQKPHAKIIFLSFSKNKVLLELLGQCDEIHLIRSDQPLHLIIDIFREIFRLRRSGVDVAIDLEFHSAFSTFMSFVSGAHQRIGFYLPAFWKRSLLTHPILFNYFRHIGEAYRSAGRKIGLDYSDLKPSKIPVAPQVTGEVLDFLKQKGCGTEEKLVGMNVNAGELAYCRRWPDEYFIKLTESIAALENVKVVFVGAPEEKLYVERLYRKFDPMIRKKIINAVGQTSLVQLIALINRFKLFITNDSGPLHLAYAQNIPTVSFWGPGHPSLYGAKEEGTHKVFYLGFDCSPCLYIYRTNAGLFCGNNAPCLKELKPEGVISYVLEFLSK